MKAVAGLVLMLVNVHLSRSCAGDGQTLFCPEMPPAFSPGFSSLVMFLRDVGEINSTVLRSDNLSSVTRLRIDSAGVTGIAEGAFSSFQNLTDLSLNQNSLTEINPNWFGRPDILRELSLTENQIEVLNESTLNGLTDLARLSLSKNRIRTIDPNTFSSCTMLAELDLSENRMTRLSPQVFSSLRSARLRLDGNPWDCSCGAEDFVDFLKDLQSRSLLDRQMTVTCESPPSLRGRPAWDVSVCMTSTVHPKPTDTLTAVPASTSETQTSVQPKPTDAPMIMSSHTATPPSRPPPETKTSVQPKPTDILTTVPTPSLRTGTFATYVTSPPSPPSGTEISVHPKPSDLPTYISTPTETCVTPRPSSDTNVVCTLVVLIVVLSLLLFVVCFVAALHRRKHNSKVVTPGRPEANELKEDGRSSLSAQFPEHSEKRENNQWDSEMGWRRSFTGVRAKSANAILFVSPFCASVKDQVTLQTEAEAQSEDTENQDEGKQKPGGESEVDGGIHTEIKNAKQPNADRNPAENPHHVSANTDTVPYLSIGTKQNKPSPDHFNQQSSDGAAQRSQMGKVMGRISTWPPTAVQWQARCKREEEEEEGSDIFTVWTPEFPGEEKKKKKKEERPSRSDRDKKENDTMEDSQTAPNQDPLKMTVAHMQLEHSQSSEPNDKTTSLSEAHAHTDARLEEMTQYPATVRQTRNLNQEKHQDLKSAKNPAHKNRAEQRNEPKRAVTSRQRAENRSTGSKAPSGGASPDDETLLSGNEYAFMDLLHEVTQNNGRWTRERWKKIHANKQRCQDRGTEGV